MRNFASFLKEKNEAVNLDDLRATAAGAQPALQAPTTGLKPSVMGQPQSYFKNFSVENLGMLPTPEEFYQTRHGLYAVTSTGKQHLGNYIISTNQRYKETAIFPEKGQAGKFNIQDMDQKFGDVPGVGRYWDEEIQERGGIEKHHEFIANGMKNALTMHRHNNI
jgi:hypothetical protein